MNVAEFCIRVLPTQIDISWQSVKVKHDVTEREDSGMTPNKALF